VPADIYAVMLATVEQAVHSQCASCAVVMGGLASGDPSYVTDVLAVTGGVLPADGLGLHPYGQRPSPDWPSPTWGFGVLADLLEAYYQVPPCCLGRLRTVMTVYSSP
jgi:hypothetical protein